MVVHNGLATATSIEVQIAAILFNIDLHVYLLHSFHLPLVISRQNSSKEIFSPLEPAETNQTIILLLHNNHFLLLHKNRNDMSKNTEGVSHGYLNENRNIANSNPVKISQL